uniref:Organic solute transporter alpha-like protein n=1 Tax=Ascaris suum TaxID=6253 RepID=F1L2I9_ASCSU
MIVDTAVKLLTDTLLNCTDGPFIVPTAGYYLSHMDNLSLIVTLLATITSLFTVALGILHLIYVSFYVTHRYRRAFIVYLAATAPFVSVFSLIAIYMPRVWFLAHLLSFFYFSIALWIIICLLMNIFEGRQKMVKKMKNECSRISVQTPPFCCVFPCLPKLDLEQERIRFCELMVFQAPCVRLFFTVLSLILYFEYQNGAFIALKVLDVVSLPSLLIGIYGTHILVTTVSSLDELMPYRYTYVFRLLDFYFMFFGIQHPIFDLLARAGVFGCGTILPALETAFFWKNFVIVLESFFVSLISTALLKPSRSALFDKYPSCPSVSSSIITRESSA